MIQSKLAIVLLAACALDAFGVGPPQVTLREVASGLDQPVDIAHAGDGSNRLFIVQKGGAIRVMRGGVLAPTPFLDITPQVDSINERGLLGLAFDPKYGANRRFFVFYTMAADGALRISEFRASAFDADRADPASERPVLTIAHPLSNHNGGKIAFGPDGFLYIATGDGGGGGDPGNNAQNTSSLLGKILRIDVGPATGYAIPPNNPFASSGGRPEVWVYGLRNPWRFSFDRQTGEVYIADVGQGSVEEVDLVPGELNGGGHDFGWNRFEGTSCFSSSMAACLLPYTRPIIEYLHDAAGGNSITGGHVYRGMRSPGLTGWYIYGDFGSNRVWAARRGAPPSSSTPGAFTSHVLIEPPGALDGISTFGEDEQGEVYVASLPSGKVYAIETPAAARNVALASAGGTAFASSEYSAAFGAAAAIDGERAGRHFGAGSGWNDGTTSWPDWLMVRFAAPSTIDRVVVYSLQDDPFDPVEPNEGTTFIHYGVQDFTVEGWTGTSWVTLARVAGNSLVKRTVEFAPVAVDRIFIHVTRSRGGYTHITEAEAWTPATRSEANLARAGAGAVAWASSSYSPAFPAAAAIDGDRAGRGWGSGSGWNDATFNAWPDWLQVHLGGLRTLDRVVVHTLQDAATNPIEPTDYTAFTSYGVQDFTVEGWTGTSWVLLGRVTGNTSVKRTIAFAPVAVDRIFVNVTRARGGYSHITEVEAWGPVSYP